MDLVISPGHLAVGAGLGAGLVGLVFWALYRFYWAGKFNRTENRLAYLEKSARLLEASINQHAEGVLIWPADGNEEVASKPLHEMLKIPVSMRKIGLIDVLNLFEGSARLELDSVVRGLRSNGEGFRLSLSSQRSKRSFGLTGQRLLSEKGVYLGDILRLRDRTEEFAELGKLNTEVKTLSAEAKRLRDLFDTLPIPIWQRANDLGIVYCNKAYKTAVEGDPTQATAHQAKKFEIAAGVLGADGRSLAQKAVNSNKALSEKHYIVIGGNRRLAEIHEIPQTSGSITGGIAGLALDYSQLDETKRELDKQDKAQGDLLEALASAIAIFGTDRRLRFYNTAFAELLSIEATWLNTKPDLGELMEALRERRQLPEVANFPEFKKSWLDLFTTLIEAQDQLLHLPDGRTWRMQASPHPLGGLVFIFDDVSDRYQQQATVNTLLAVQRETIDNLYEAIAVFGEDGRLRLHNPEFLKLWQIPPQLISSEPHLSDVFADTQNFFADTQGWTDFKVRLLQRLNNHSADAGRMERADGSVLSYSIVPLPDGGSLFSYVNVTDSVNIEKALVERTRALEAADQLKSEFIANVSYGLRAPLTTIIGFGEILQNHYFGDLNDKQMEYTRGILESSQKLLGLINDILDLATIEAGYMTLQYSNFDIHSLLIGVVNLVRDRAQNQGLQLHFDCPQDIGGMAGDEKRLRQVVFNLITNAMNFTPNGGKIQIIAKKSKKQLVLKVEDTGQGIAETDQARVFNKFERGSGKKSGAGLGLSIVKSLIELHGGTVELQSKPGKGTVVSCALPLAKSE
jgi:nitrogen-specific signal transduction histidine kinase